MTFRKLHIISTGGSSSSAPLWAEKDNQLHSDKVRGYNPISSIFDNEINYKVIDLSAIIWYNFFHRVTDRQIGIYMGNLKWKYHIKQQVLMI